jgi:hypothetical protein
MSQRGLMAGVRRTHVIGASAAAAVLSAVPAFASHPKVPAPTSVTNQLFSWYQTGTPAPTNPQFIGAPFLSDGSATAVNAYLQGLAPGAIRAVKVTTPLSDSTANLIFNNTSYHVSYVFGDVNAGKISDLVKQVRFQDGPGHKRTQSGKAFVGNFGFEAPFFNQIDDQNHGNPHVFANSAQTNSSNGNGNGNGRHRHKLTMSNEDAYPGSPIFPNLASGDKPPGGGSYANIRSSLFILPIQAVTDATQRIDKLHLNAQNIPWTANFNNYGNLGLDNDRDASNGYTFVPGAPMVAKTVDGVHYPALSGSQTANQMMSERDFAVMATHMRMRGADSLSLLDSGIVGVSQQQMQNDAVTGWNGEFSMTAIFNQADHQLLLDGFGDGDDHHDNVNHHGQGNNGGSTHAVFGHDDDSGHGGNNNFCFDDCSLQVDGHDINSDKSGVIVSGVYSLCLGKLDVLLSNMDDSQHKITLPCDVGGYSLAVQDFTLGGGNHLLVEYSLKGNCDDKEWKVIDQHTPFTAISDSRNGFGIPEPGTLSLLAIGAIFGLNRRSRKGKA